MIRIIIVVAALFLAGVLVTGSQTPVGYDVLIRGGTVIDGSGRPRYRADVGIRGDRIARVAPGGLPVAGSAQVLEADSLVVAPGFIDHHAHIQTTIHEYPLAENFVRQGITTVLASLHSGDQPWPLDRYMSACSTSIRFRTTNPKPLDDWPIVRASRNEQPDDCRGRKLHGKQIVKLDRERPVLRPERAGPGVVRSGTRKRRTPTVACPNFGGWNCP